MVPRKHARHHLTLEACQPRPRLLPAVARPGHVVLLQHLLARVSRQLLGWQWRVGRKQVQHPLAEAALPGVGVSLDSRHLLRGNVGRCSR